MNPHELVNHFLTVLDLESQAISQARLRFQEPEETNHILHAFRLLTESLDQGGKIVVTGLGKSGKVASKIAATLSSTGSPAIYLHPTEGLHGDLGILQSQDVVVALSHSGNTDEILALLPSLVKRSVKLIGIGGNRRSRLAQSADCWLNSSVEHEACPHDLAPTTSTTLALAIGDALAVGLMKARGFDVNAFAKNHPAGSLGRKLSMTVESLLHSVEPLAPDSSVQSVISRATDSGLGAVLVGSSTTLLGLITDGDIRRALSREKEFFQLKARDMMTPQPITVPADELAHVALRLMEDRPRPLNVLPVIHPTDQRPIGILRLHDLIKIL
jgi:arabinose-5-phosphate isomerase